MRALLVVVAGLFATAAGAVALQLPDARVAEGDGSIAQARLTGPTDRYRHFVLGAQMEASGLEVVTRDGRLLAFMLPPDEVFEDRRPRLADLNGDGRDEVVLVRSSRRTGSSLVVIGVREGHLEIIAEGPATGAPQRWLNPAGIADFDGDGRLDIAYVQQPHAVGRLHVFTLRGDVLAEIAEASDTSNHVAGSSQIGLAAVADFDGDGISDLAVPSFDRQRMRFLSFRGGVHQIAEKVLPGAVVADSHVVTLDGRPAVEVGLSGGRRVTVAP